MQYSLQLIAVMRILILLLLLLTLLEHATSNTISISISANNLTINQLSTYTFKIDRRINPLTYVYTANPTPVSLNSYILLTFPTQFISIAATSTLPCLNIDNSAALTCTISNANQQITINGYYNSSTTLANAVLNIQISNITNAYKSGLSGNFQYAIYNANGTLIDSGPPTTNTAYSTALTFVPSSFASSIITASAYVSAWSTLLFSLTPTNAIPPSGQLVIQLPLTWQNDVTSTDTLATTPTCSAISNVSSSLSCSYSILQSPINQVVITISNLTTSSLASAFSLSVGSILMPPYIGDTQAIGLYTQWSDGSQIDTGSAAVSGLSAMPVQSMSLTSSSSNAIINVGTTVQSAFTAILTLTLSRSFYYLDTIQLVLPNIFINATLSSTSLSFTSTRDTNTLTLTNFPSSPSTISPSNSFVIQLSSINNPISTAPVTLSAVFLRNGGVYMSGSATYSATAGIANSCSMAGSSQFVRVVGDGLITFNTNLSIPVGAIIQISYPATTTATDTSLINITSASLNGVSISSAQMQVKTNKLIITSLFSTASTSSLIALVTVPAFTNPPTTQPSIYLLSITDSNSYSILTCSSTFTASPKPLVSNIITPSSYTALNYPTTYSLQVQSNYEFTSVSILIPSSIQVMSGYASTCTPNSFSSCILTSINSSLANLTYIGSLPAGSYVLAWGNTLNPTSLAPTASFQIYTYVNGYNVEISQGYLSLVMTAMAAFPSAVIYPSSFTNSALVNVSLLPTLPAYAPAGVITIVMPSVLGMSGSSCAGCSFIGNNISINYSGSSSSLSITVMNVSNAPSFNPVSNISFYLKSNDGYLSVYSSLAAWTNTNPSSFTTAVSSINGYLGESANFNYVLSQMSAAQTNLTITINSQFPALSVAPSGTSLLSSFVLQLNISQLLSVSVNFNLVCPIYSGTYTFQLLTYDANGYQVGSSISNAWSPDCYGTVCRSCSYNASTNMTACSTCYNSTISNYYILNSTTSTCIRACPTGNYLLNTTCYPCSANCLQCVNASANCTSCSSSSSSSNYLDTVYAVCVATCRSGYYANTLNQQCGICVSPCLTCTSNVLCLTCIISYYLLNGQCLSACPSNYYIGNQTSRVCMPCSAHCLTCSQTTSNCTSCNNSLSYYMEVNSCVSVCSSQYFLVNNTCIYCQSPCMTCVNSTSTCATCLSAYPIWYNFTCIISTACPIGNYVNSTNQSCNLCPAVCTQCTSLTACTTCISGYSLYSAACISSCPNTTYSVSQVCIFCNGCLTCNPSNGSLCTSCVSPKYYYEALCYSNCPSGTYISSSTNCTVCISQCPTCLNASYCLSCVSPQLYYVGNCYSGCPTGTYPNSTTLCAACLSSCLTCTALNVCQSCSSGYFLQSSSCVTTCSLGVGYQAICYPCGLHCLVCSSGTCQLCNTGYLLYNNTCITQCPSSQLSLDLIHCVPCTNKFTNCTTCNVSACLSCNEGQLVAGYCIPCYAGYYSAQGTCSACPSTCSICTSLTYCSSCVSGNYLANNQCVGVCPANMLPNGTICSICVSNCAICQQSSGLCSVCTAGWYMYSNLCVSTCPDDLVVNINFTLCVTQQVYYEEYSQQSKIIPFPFTIASVIVIIIIAVLKCYRPITHLPTTIVAVLSFLELGAWAIFILMQVIYLLNYHSTAMRSVICGGLAIVATYIINCLHIGFVNRYIKSDSQFIKWSKKWACHHTSMMVVSTTFSFKFYRLIHSRLLDREELSMQLSSVSKILPFNLVSVLSMLLCSAPVIVGCSLALYSSIAIDQQFFIALDVLIVTGIMLLVLLLDLHHGSTYFIDQVESNYLKKKMYEQDYAKVNVEGMSEGSKKDGNDGGDWKIEEDEGQMNIPTEMKTNIKSNNKNLPKSQLLIQSINNTHNKFNQSNENLQRLEEDDGSSEIEQSQNRLASKWQPKQFDHHGYRISYDAQGNRIRTDEYGYRIQIDEKGVHHRYNSDGHEISIERGEHIARDKDGWIVRDGKRYNEQGLQVRNNGGQWQFYDQNGWKIVDGVAYDEDGNRCVIQNGQIHKYNRQGYKVEEEGGKIVYKDEKGIYKRLNKNGEWESYDPEDNFALVTDQQTGQITKYDEDGFRVVYDKFKNISRYDQDGYRIVKVGQDILRYDPQGYRVEITQDGIRRFDRDGYELVTTDSGRKVLRDGHGYTVERDAYGGVTLKDADGLIVVIDKDGRHRKYNQQGLEVVEEDGKVKLIDKRGREVREINDGQTYEKYDENGNKIWLDDEGCEVEYDSQGNMIRYDKVGDVVPTEQVIEDSQLDQEQMRKDRPKANLYSYKSSKKQMDLEEEYQKLLSGNALIIFDEEEGEGQDLKEFHDIGGEDGPIDANVEEMLEEIVGKERNALQVDDNGPNLSQLQDIDHTPYVNLHQKKNERSPSQEAVHNAPIAARNLKNDRKPGQLLSMKSVADISISQQEHLNDGVQPMENRTEFYDEDEEVEEIGFGKTKRKNRRSEVSLVNGNKSRLGANAKTEYNYNTVEVNVKKKNALYDQQEEIESLSEELWQEQMGPVTFVKPPSSVAPTNDNIIYLEEDAVDGEMANQDTLSEYLNSARRRNHQEEEGWDGQLGSIEEKEDQLFERARERRQFKLSGAPNPLVEYAKNMEAKKKSLQQKMYLDSYK